MILIFYIVGQVIVRGPPMVDMNFDLGTRELAEQMARASTTLTVQPTSTTVVPMPSTTTFTTSQSPTPIQTQQNLRTAVAMYDFETNNPDELPFKRGDIITIHQETGQWWLGEINGRRGLIPANYVQ